MGTNLVVLLILGLVVGETTANILNFHGIYVARFNRMRRNSTHRAFETIPDRQPKPGKPAFAPASAPAPPSAFASTLEPPKKPEPAPVKESAPTSTFAATPAPAKAQKSTFAPMPTPAKVKAAASTFAPTPAPAKASAPASAPAPALPKTNTYVYVDYNNQYLGTYNQPPEAFGFKRVDGASEGEGGNALGVNAASFYAVPYEAAQPAGGEVITVRVPSAPYGPVPLPLQRQRQAFPSYEDGKGLERDFNHHHHHDGNGHTVYHAGSHRAPNYDPIDFDPSYNFVEQEQRRRRPADYRKYRVPYDHGQQLD